MGFFDSMKNAQEKKSKELNETLSRSNYRTTIEDDDSLLRKYRSMNDSDLINKYNNSSSLSDKEVDMIRTALINRGYYEQNGYFRKA